LTLIVAIVACTLISLADGGGMTENPKGKKIKEVSIEQALKIPGLKAAMYHQIDQEDLMHSPSHIFVAKVMYSGTTFLISGTLDQWMRFFRNEGLPPINKQRAGTTL